MYSANDAVITEPALIIRINRLYRCDMTCRQLYAVTRGYWRVVPPRRDQAEYAFAVYKGIIKEVYKIDNWQPATSQIPDRNDPPPPGRPRYQFEGSLAKDIRNKYLEKSVSHYFQPGDQYPVRYINV